LKPILLFAAALCVALAGCADVSAPPKPELPLSVSPGWTAKAFDSSAPPDGLPEGAKPVCWKADYTGAGGATAAVWVCGYAHGAFEPMQRARAAANTLKFYKGRYLVIVRWNGGTRADLLALMRTLEGALTE
jgi:hypothetical protein